MWKPPYETAFFSLEYVIVLLSVICTQIQTSVEEHHALRMVVANMVLFLKSYPLGDTDVCSIDY